LAGSIGWLALSFGLISSVTGADGLSQPLLYAIPTANSTMAIAIAMSFLFADIRSFMDMIHLKWFQIPNVTLASVGAKNEFLSRPINAS
jgi:ABC-type proline/glycine betaine transport system permease subunit